MSDARTSGPEFGGEVDGPRAVHMLGALRPDHPARTITGKDDDRTESA